MPKAEPTHHFVLTASYFINKYQMTYTLCVAVVLISEIEKTDTDHYWPHLTTGPWSLCSLSRAATAIIALCVFWRQDIVHLFRTPPATPTTIPGPLVTNVLCSGDTSDDLVSYKNITDHVGLSGKIVTISHFNLFSTSDCSARLSYQRLCLAWSVGAPCHCVNIR